MRFAAVSTLALALAASAAIIPARSTATNPQAQNLRTNAARLAAGMTPLPPVKRSATEKARK